MPLPSSLPQAPASRARRPGRRLLPPDMTPMAGVGFLLVTFFLLTSALNKPTLMELAMPVKPTPDDEYVGHCCGSALTVVLGAGNRLFYYWGQGNGEPAEELRETNLGSGGLRQLLLGFRRESCPVVLIKSTDGATYHTLVDVLDELHITATRSYALADLTQNDKRLLLHVR